LVSNHVVKHKIGKINFEILISKLTSKYFNHLFGSLSVHNKKNFLRIL
jgi:hypothetical protein